VKIFRGRPTINGRGIYNARARDKILENENGDETSANRDNEIGGERKRKRASERENEGRQLGGGKGEGRGERMERNKIEFIPCNCFQSLIKYFNAARALARPRACFYFHRALFSIFAIKISRICLIPH